MAPVFAHGRLRLYLLKLLDESPRHGYEVIRLLEERFQGLYAPSAGTVYPRLAKLEKEGLVTHTTEGGRKVYTITTAGRAELAARAEDIAGLEAEIRESVSALAEEIREDVRGAAGDLRREMRAAAQRTPTAESDSAGRWFGPDRTDLRQDWKEQARREREESRRAREEARAARRQAKAAHEAMDNARDEVQRIARQVQEQVQTHARSGDWQTGLREGLAELTRELSQFTQFGTFGAPTTGKESDGPPDTPPRSSSRDTPRVDPYVAECPEGTESTPGAANGGYAADPAKDPGGPLTPPSADPLRDLERLLDRFRDDIRDAARDLGVDDSRLREVRRLLKAAAAHITAALHQRGPTP